MELIKGCTVDGDCTTCVFDDPEYKISDCRVASRLFDEGKGRDACPDWKPTADEKHAQAHIIAECESLRAEIAQLTAERDRLKSALTRLRHNWPTEEQTVWAYAGEVSDIAEEALQEAK